MFRSWVEQIERRWWQSYRAADSRQSPAEENPSFLKVLLCRLDRQSAGCISIANVVRRERSGGVHFRETCTEMIWTCEAGILAMKPGFRLPECSTVS
jgi:hypothetical protein